MNTLEFGSLRACHSSLITVNVQKEYELGLLMNSAGGPAFRFFLDGLSRTDNTIATGQHGVTIPGAPSLTLFKGGFLV